MSESLSEQLAASAVSGSNADFIEDLYARFLKDPQSVDPSWARYFAGLPQVRGAETAPRRTAAPRPPAPAGAAVSAAAPSAPARPAAADSGAASAKQAAVSRLIQVYANRGHLIAHLDPLDLTPRSKPYLLDPGYFGLSEADMETEFVTGSRTPAIPSRSKLKDILSELKFI
jgi:2-oxoglutarate dehydrogenase E1 component